MGDHIVLNPCTRKLNFNTERRGDLTSAYIEFKKKELELN